MKTIVPLLLICLIFLTTPLSHASAHFLLTDKSIGALLHIDPNDAPIAGQQSILIFNFKDQENKFKPQNCTCTLYIIENGTPIYTQPLFQNSTNPLEKTTSIVYTFPKKDIYQIQVTGIPITPQAFQKFILTYNMRVDEDIPSSSQNILKTNILIQPLTYIIIVIGSGILYVLWKKIKH